MGGRRFDASAAMFLQQASTTRDDPTANRVMTIEHLSDGLGSGCYRWLVGIGHSLEGQTCTRPERSRRATVRGNEWHDWSNMRSDDRRCGETGEE